MIVRILPLTRALRAKARKDHDEMATVAEAIADRQAQIELGSASDAGFLLQQIKSRQGHIARLADRKALLLVVAEELDLLFIKHDICEITLDELERPNG